MARGSKGAVGDSLRAVKGQWGVVKGQCGVCWGGSTYLLERGHGRVTREAVAGHDGLRVHLLLDQFLRLPEELACDI